jgi:transposase
MPKKYKVTITDIEIAICKDIVTRGYHSGEKRNRARALILLNDDETDAEVAGVLGMSLRGIEALRKRFIDEGFETVLNGKPRGHRPCILNDEDKARLVQLSCEITEDGAKRWTLREMSKRIRELCGKIVSHETIRKTLKMHKC